MKGAAGGRPARTGRRRGSSDTRDRILAAARAAFGELGFKAATVRGVAARATDRPDADLRAIGPILQRYLTGDLGGAEPRAEPRAEPPA